TSAVPSPRRSATSTRACAWSTASTTKPPAAPSPRPRGWTRTARSALGARHWCRAGTSTCRWTRPPRRTLPHSRAAWCSSPRTHRSPPRATESVRELAEHRVHAAVPLAVEQRQLAFGRRLVGLGHADQRFQEDPLVDAVVVGTRAAPEAGGGDLQRFQRQLAHGTAAE